MGEDKICFFLHFMSEGGAEKMTAVLANELAKRGHKAVLLVRKRGEERFHILSPQVQLWNMDIEGLPKFQKNRVNVRYLRRIYRDESVKAVFCVTVQMSQVAALASFFIKRKQPLICVVHNTTSRERGSFHWLRRLLLPLFNRRFDAVIAVSEAAKADYIRQAHCGARPCTSFGEPSAAGCIRKAHYGARFRTGFGILSGDSHGRRAHRSVPVVYTAYNPVVFPALFEMAKEKTGHPWLAVSRTWKTLARTGCSSSG